MLNVPAKYTTLYFDLKIVAATRFEHTTSGSPPVHCSELGCGSR